VVSLGWLAAGLAVVVVILFLGYRINRKKATARLALRLAEAYRSQEQFDTAQRLYGVPTELDQNLQQARKGSRLARRGETEPVIEPALMHRAQRRLAEDPEGLADLFARYGIEVDLPPLETEDE